MASIYRDQGDTGPAIGVQLLVGGSPFALTGASVWGVVAGTVGSGVSATYQRFTMVATWTVASAVDASVTIPLNPSGLAPSAFACASPGVYKFQIQGVDSGGVKYSWPQRTTIPFIVRITA